MSCSLSGGRLGAAVNIGRMMERLGIDPAYGVLPRYGVVFSSAWRTLQPLRRVCGMHKVVG